jgi:micrococcal nuclease
MNTEIVQEGFTGHDVPNDKEGSYIDAEKDARGDKRGLWADAHPIPPWEWQNVWKRGQAQLPPPLIVPL